DDGYGIDDIIGESGIEAAYENELRGGPGILTVTLDADGNVTEEITKNPVRGNTIMLTIDKDLQRVTQKELAKKCEEINSINGAGAAVVQKTDSGEILAAASYPTFDLKDYYKNYKKLAKNKRNPMWNRFALGQYAPGSTFKPMMSCAALEEGAITEDTTFRCKGIFQYYDIELGCEHKKVHGTENVRLALRDSCNIFFYNCADLLGITKMNEYGKMFGLGEKTGVEIAESAGVFASPAVAEQYGVNWQMGDTIQAGIGQSYHLFTPLQLANYCATIANNGTRYESHFVKAIIDSSTKAVNETSINVVENLPISNKTFTTVKEGMRLVAGNLNAFNKIKTPVACKTGTSQVKKNGVKSHNAFLITFAPYKKPEIAVATAVEYAESSGIAVPVTAAIIDYYYSNNKDKAPAQETGSLLD
ncbi:MAG: penicillin-binding protein, partial [Eubacterium sp.]|nr:penicillin-binding protein [Eubacterium sp.]